MKRKTESIDLKNGLENKNPKNCKENQNQSNDKEKIMNKYGPISENEKMTNFEIEKQEIKKDIENKKRNMPPNTKFMNGKHNEIVWWYYPICSEETFQMVSNFQTFVRQHPNLFLNCESEDRSVYGYICYFDSSIKTPKEKLFSSLENNSTNCMSESNGYYSYRYPLGMILRNFLWSSHPLNNESFETLIQETLKRNKEYHQRKFLNHYQPSTKERSQSTNDSFRIMICLSSAVIDLCSKLNKSYEKSNVYGSFSIECLTFKEFQNLGEKILTDYIFLESHIPIFNINDLANIVLNDHHSNKWKLSFFPFLSLLQPYSSQFNKMNEKQIEQNLFQLELSSDYCFGWNSLMRSIVANMFQIPCKRKYNKDYKMDLLSQAIDEKESDWIFSIIHQFFDSLSFPYYEDFYKLSLIHGEEENNFSPSLHPSVSLDQQNNYVPVEEKHSEYESREEKNTHMLQEMESLKNNSYNVSDKEEDHNSKENYKNKISFNVKSFLESSDKISTIVKSSNLPENNQNLHDKSFNDKQEWMSKKEISSETNIDKNMNLNNVDQDDYEKTNMEIERKNQENILMDRVKYYGEILKAYLEQHQTNTNWPSIHFDFRSHHFRYKFHCCESFFSFSSDKDPFVFENDPSLSFSNVFLFSSTQINDDLEESEKMTETNTSQQSNGSTLSNISLLNQQKIKSKLISKSNQCKLINERIVPIRVYDIEVKNQLPLFFEWMEYTDIFVNFPILIYVIWNDKHRKLSVALFMRHSIIDTNIFYKLSRIQTEDPSNVSLFQRNISMFNQCFGKFLRAWSYFLSTQPYSINENFPFSLKDLFYKIRLIHENDENAIYMCIGLDIWSYLLPIDSINELQQELSAVKQLFRKKYHSGNLFKETHTILEERYNCLLMYSYILEDHQKNPKLHPIIQSFFDSTTLFFPSFSSNHSSSSSSMIEGVIEKEKNDMYSENSVEKSLKSSSNNLHLQKVKNQVIFSLSIENQIDEKEMKTRDEWWKAIVLLLASLGIQTCCQFSTVDECNQLNKNWSEKIQQYEFFYLTNTDQSKLNSKTFYFNPFPSGSIFGNFLTKLFAIQFQSMKMDNFNDDKKEITLIDRTKTNMIDEKKIYSPFYQRVLEILKSNIYEKWIQGNEWMSIWYTNATNTSVFQKYQKCAQTFFRTMADMDGNQPSLAILRIPSYSGKQLIANFKKISTQNWEEEYHNEVVDKVIEYFEKLKTSTIEFPILTKWIPMQFHSDTIEEHGIGIGVTRAVCQQIFDSIHRSKFGQYFQYSNRRKYLPPKQASSHFLLSSNSGPYSQQGVTQEHSYSQQIDLMQAGCFYITKSIEKEKTKLVSFFFAIGALLRYLLIHNIEIQTHFPFWCFRFLSPQSQIKFHLNDLYQSDPNTAKSIQDLYLLEDDQVIEDLYLDFSDLQIDGLSGKVTKNELHQYLDTKISLLFQRQWEKEWIRQFYMGFHLTTLDFELNSSLVYRFFSSSNQLSFPLLLSLLHLDPDLVSDRKKHHSSKCFHQEHILPGNVNQRCSFSALVEFLRTCSIENLTQFYSFITGANHFGSFQLPNSNSNYLYISDNDGSKLPTSTTCTKTLYLYSLPKKKYSCLETFQKDFNHKLLLAIQNSQFFVLR